MASWQAMLHHKNLLNIGYRDGNPELPSPQGPWHQHTVQTRLLNSQVIIIILGDCMCQWLCAVEKRLVKPPHSVRNRVRTRIYGWSQHSMDTATPSCPLCVPCSVRHKGWYHNLTATVANKIPWLRQLRVALSVGHVQWETRVGTTISRLRLVTKSRDYGNSELPSLWAMFPR